MAKMILTLGLPASGKTTWANQYVAENPNTVIVCRDDIRAELFSPKVASYRGDLKLFVILNQQQIKTLENQGKVNYNGTTLKKSDFKITTDVSDFRWRDYRFTTAKEKRVTVIQEQRITEAMNNKQDIIIADTNLNPKVQVHLNAIAKSNNYEVSMQDFTSVPVVECIRRDERRDNSVGRGVILGMFERYICKEAPAHDPNLPNAVVFDMDGTLAHMNGKRSPFEWDKVMLDDPDFHVVELTNLYKAMGYKIIVFTARDGVCEDLCAKWLKKYDVPYDALFTRDENDTRKDYTAKQEMYENNLLGKYNVHCAFDDREQVVYDVWYRNGIKVFQCGIGAF
jgi:predicted kinase